MLNPTSMIPRHALNFAAIVIDGMDDYNTSAAMALRWQGGVTPANIAIGTSFARFTGNGGQSQANAGNIIAANFANKVTCFFAISMNFQLAPGGGAMVFFSDSGTTQVDFRFNSNGSVTITRNGTSLATSSTGVVTTNIWHRFEFKATINSSTGFAECVQDGVSIVSFTGNTQATSSAQINSFLYRGTNVNGNTCWFDDMALYDDTGVAPNTYYGDRKILTTWPITNGSVNQFTPTFASYVNGTAYVVGQQLKDTNNNVQRCTTAGTATTATPTWATTGGATTSVGGGCVFTVVGTGSNPGAQNWMAVSENPGDNDNSYNADSTVNHEDAYGFTAITATSIVSTTTAGLMRKDDAGTRSIRFEASSGGTTVNNGTDIPVSSSYADYQATFATDPNTSAAWTQSGLNAAEFRVKVVA